MATISVRHDNFHHCFFSDTLSVSLRIGVDALMFELPNAPVWVHAGMGGSRVILGWQDWLNIAPAIQYVHTTHGQSKTHLWGQFYLAT